MKTRVISSNLLITEKGEIIKNPLIYINKDAIITDIVSISDKQRDAHPNVEFYNGIITPTFINSHSHLELSNMKGIIEKNIGMAAFIKEVIANRNWKSTVTLDSILNDLYIKGTSFIGDICNSAKELDIKSLFTKEKKIEFFNFIELFSFERDSKKLDSFLSVNREINASFKEMGLNSSITMHSPYSSSFELWDKFNSLTTEKETLSIHFMESNNEVSLFEKKGDIYKLFKTFGNNIDAITGEYPYNVIINAIDKAKHTLLVHNTVITNTVLKRLIPYREKVSMCLCPLSNMYIENRLPDYNLIQEHGFNIVLGTDSLASNSSLDIFLEMIAISNTFNLDLLKIIPMVSNNANKIFGTNISIKKGEKAKLVLIENIDCLTLKLNSNSTSRRLV